MTAVCESEIIECLEFADYLGKKLRIPADDARQEAAVALLEKAVPSFDPLKAQFATFANRCIRQRLLNVAVVYSPDARILDVDEADCAAEVSEARHGEEYVALRDAMATLTPGVRQALEMRFGDNESKWHEIGAALGCTRGTAMAMVTAGLAKLRGMME